MPANKQLITDLLNDPKKACYISQENNVLIVGPGASYWFSVDKNKYAMPQDMHIFSLLHRLKGGRMTILDMPNNVMTPSSKDIDGIEKYLNYLVSEAGIFSCPIEILRGDIMKGALTARYDVLIDHLTWNFILQSSEDIKIEDIAKVYSDSLNEHGKILVYYKQKESGSIQPMAEVFKKSGFHINTYRDFLDAHQIEDATLQIHLGTQPEYLYRRHERLLYSFYLTDNLLVASKK